MKFSTQHFRISLLSGVMMVAAAASSTAAGDPDAFPRYFAELTPSGREGVNFEADGSRRIVAHRDGKDADVIQFGTPAGPWFPSHFAVRDDDGTVIFDLTGTTWVRVPILHITDSGTEQIRVVYWLVGDDAPATGLTAATGPDGSVFRFVSFGVTQIDSADPYGNAGKFRVIADGSVEFVVSVGLFNK